MTATAMMTSPAPTTVSSFAVTRGALRQLGRQPRVWFGGALLVEMIFGFPGVGNLMVQAVKGNDLPLIQGIALIFCVMMLAITVIVDVLYAVLNPRLRTL